MWCTVRLAVFHFENLADRSLARINATPRSITQTRVTYVGLKDNGAEAKMQAYIHGCVVEFDETGWKLLRQPATRSARV